MSEQYTKETWEPLVSTNDLHNGLVKVEMFIPDLEPSDDKFHPINGKVSLDFLRKGFGFDMKTVLVDKTKNLKTTYKFRVKQLPERIVKSDWDVEKGKIVVMMEKHSNSRNIDWNLAVKYRGLDQESSSSSSDDD